MQNKSFFFKFGFGGWGGWGGVEGVIRQNGRQGTSCSGRAISRYIPGETHDGTPRWSVQSTQVRMDSGRWYIECWCFPQTPGASSCRGSAPR